MDAKYTLALDKDLTNQKFTLHNIKNDEIIRNDFVQYVKNSQILCEKYMSVIKKTVWKRDEISQTMINVISFGRIHINEFDLAQCPEVIINLIRDKHTYISIYNFNNDIVPNNDTIALIIESYPKKCTIPFLLYVYKYNQSIVETFYKINGSNLLNMEIEMHLRYILPIGYLDYFILIEKYIPKEHFLNCLCNEVHEITNIDLLDYILLNYNILNPNTTLYLIKKFNYNTEIMRRCQMHGQFDIYTSIILQKTSSNFVKMLYYLFVILDKKEAIDYLPKLDYKNFNEEECKAILNALYFYKIYYRSLTIKYELANKVNKYYYILHKSRYTYDGKGTICGLQKSHFFSPSLLKMDLKNITIKEYLNILKYRPEEIVYVPESIKKVILLDFVIMSEDNTKYLSHDEIYDIEIDYICAMVKN